MASLHRDLVDPFVPVVRDASGAARARRLLREGVIAARDFPDVAYDDGRCWAQSLPRGHARHLHGMIFLSDWHAHVLSAESAAEAERRRAVSAAADIFLRWQEVVADLDDTSMAYHDETTAQRLLQLCRFLDDQAVDVDEARRGQLASLATSTAELLVTDDFYAGVNNHGMFQDLALLRYAAGSEKWLPPDASLRSTAVSQSVERLNAYFAAAFTTDGVHVENSPAYHLMVARSLRDVIPAVRAVDLQKATTLEGIYEGAERFAVQSIMPNGTIAPLGDTKVMTVGRTGHNTTFSGPAFRFAVSQGREGERPAERTVVFSEGGYAMHRTAWGDPDAYLMTFKAAYLAQYHHHCDDLALTLFGHGRWLLSEAGPNGYDYKNPLTKYAYSQHAHNVVIIDGRSLPRVDQEPGGVGLVDRTHEPPLTPRRRSFGGLRSLWSRSQEQAGSLTVGKDPSLLHVTGTNSRFASARHERDVHVTEPDGRLQIIVTDTVEHQDGQGHLHEVLWHIGPGVDVVLGAQRAQLFVGTAKVLELSWSGDSDASASMVVPRDAGRVQAMRFPTFGRHEPGSVIRVTSRGKGLSLTTTIHGTTPAD